MNTRLIRKLAGALAMLSATACFAQSAAPAPAAGAQPRSAAPAVDLKPDTVLLENGPIKVTVADFEAAMTRFPEELRAEARANPETIMKIIDALFVNRTLAYRAAQSGLDKETSVRLRGEQVREGYLSQKYLEVQEKQAKLPNLEGRAEELFKADSKKYVVPAMVQLQHIVVSPAWRTREEAIARANEARAKLVAGARLADVAKDYSDDPQVRRHNGDLGWVRLSDLDTALGPAVFAAKPGEWNAPLATRSGVHLFRVAARREQQQQTFAEVKATIIEQESERLRKRANEDMLARIRNDPANTVYPDRLQALKSDIDERVIEKTHRDAIERIQAQPH